MSYYEMIIQERFKTVEQLETLLELSAGWIRTITREGKLKGYKVGRQWRYRNEDVDEFVLKEKENKG